MTAVPALTAVGVTVDVGGRRLLDDVSLPVHAGELVALVGPNGAGKSTLLGVLAGDRSPTGGVVRLAGRDLAGEPPGQLARARAVLLQEQRVAFSFRVRQVVEMGRTPWRRTDRAADDERLVDAALAEADVATLVDRLHPTLSGGERARTAFARVLAQDVPVLLLDEPTAALDIHHQERLLDSARAVARAGGAVVAVLHDLTLAAAHADVVAVLAEGRLRALGPPAHVLTGPLLSDVYRHPVDVLPHPVTGAPLVLPRRTAALLEVSS
ncbi:heme ABC transporter ATP-binding protein [Modestobacter roseus]|uniref:Iron complex transport system ATP-binding protein n=1 Tax=Modestobacter roseus TaxID=1181884 RepID=A0A562IQQ1_9ACTN|nr:heme ABC transporter ATP-binding protein [Modestobacter roseus]MQA34459.1 heme ABC transporter ATP-binding protein [Modestobacter roseus]TWH73055.1 iron complex transport system ATP-binding protein [Modestobacter roseus]